MMNTNENKIYVGNLPYSTTENEFRETFGQFGKVSELNLIKDRHTDQCKGFGFVTYETNDSAQHALTFDGQEFKGRKLKVNIARERTANNRNRNGRGGRRQGGWRGGNDRGNDRDRY